MGNFSQEILIIIGITIFLISITIGIVLLITLYNRKQHALILEKKIMGQHFESELLRTEIEVQEQTRKNLASDLHDNIGQILSLTNVTLASINILDKEKAIQKINETQNLVIRSIKELRQLSKIIHGEQLIQLGLIETIQQEINWLERNGHYTIHFKHYLVELEETIVTKDLFIYRLLQESLNNIIKHSGANTISIELIYENQIMYLTIKDNGIGFIYTEASNNSNGLGLASMQKRVELLKGAFQIESVPNQGTTLNFSIPYENSKDQ